MVDRGGLKVLGFIFATVTIAVMLTAVPSGAFGVLFAIRYGVASAQIGTMLIASTLLSTVTLTAAILLSSGWSWTRSSEYPQIFAPICPKRRHRRS